MYIEPRLLKGFRDFLPREESIRQNFIEKIEAAFRSFGFTPIDTPALEYADILLGKGGGETEKQIYRFKDNGQRDIALRFDLTVPFARFTALHKAQLSFPFKRYHIGKVWRGENTQKGRYREFTQCDVDIIGSDSAASDFEIILLIHQTMQALGADAGIHINHRGLFNRFLTHIDQSANSVEILRTVDKLSKIGDAETKKILEELTGASNAQKIIEFISAKGSFTEVLDHLIKLAGGKCPESDRLSALYKYLQDALGPSSEGIFTLSPSITRGLDYYTGVVFETFLNEMPGIGSVCSGGRYDNLAGLYMKGDPVSGVGASLGLDRMIAALESLGKLPASFGHSVAIACVKADKSGEYQGIAVKLRKAGIPCEVFVDEKDLVKQYQFAEKKGLRYVIIPGDNTLALRDLTTRKNIDLSIDEIINFLGVRSS